MDIYDVLKSQTGARISLNSSRWMVLDESLEDAGCTVYTVYEREPGARQTKTLYNGEDEEIACAILVEE